MIYCVQGIRHECFVQAKTPEEAVELAKNHVNPTWEWPEVYEADWINGVLQPKDDSPIYRHHK